MEGQEQSFFNSMVDELVEFAEYDQELFDGIQWIDMESRKRGITFYEMVFLILHNYDVDMKAKEWMDGRN